MQAPALPGTAHDRQVSVHAVRQHTPWAQIPELQSSAPAHDPPSGFLPQLPPLHELGATHWAAVVHDVEHRPSEPQA